MEEEGLTLAGNEASAEAEASRAEMKQIIRQAIESLPRGEREVYQLRGMKSSREQVARRLGITLPAVKSRLHRARANLRQYMDRALSNS